MSVTEATLDNTIVLKKQLTPEIFLLKFKVPLLSKKAQPGQFCVIRAYETSERIPLTFADFDPDEETITIVFQPVGKSTLQLAELNEGDSVLDIIGPLGHASKIEKVGTAMVIGGGTGIACVYPIGRALKNAGNKLISIIGARTAELLFWQDELKDISDQLLITTDDGSCGWKGFVTDELDRLIAAGRRIDVVFAIGPAVMMQAVAALTEKHGIKTVVSLNSIMVDGTGMCGACRVEVGGRTRFVCVDGPEFDGHKVNFKQLMDRQKQYIEEEKQAVEIYQQEKKHQCRCAG